MSWEISHVLAEVGVLGANFGIAEGDDEQIFLFTGCCRGLHANPSFYSVGPVVRTGCCICGETYELPYFGNRNDGLYAGTSFRPTSHSFVKEDQESYALAWISQWTDVENISVEVKE